VVSFFREYEAPSAAHYAPSRVPHCLPAKQRGSRPENKSKEWAEVRRASAPHLRVVGGARQAARGPASTGERSLASGERSPSEGEGLPASGERSPSEGEGLPASGERSPSEGEGFPSTIERSASEGEDLPASGERSPSEGKGFPSTIERSPFERPAPPLVRPAYPPVTAPVPAVFSPAPAPSERSATPSSNRIRASMRFSSRPTTSIVPFESLSLISWSFFSRLAMSGPPVRTRRRVTICACSSSIRWRYSPICSRKVATRCSRVPISSWIFTRSPTCALMGPSSAADDT